MKKWLTFMAVFSAVVFMGSAVYAGQGFIIKISNRTSQNVTVTPVFFSCWYDNDLGHAVSIKPGGTVKLYTEACTSGDCLTNKNFRSCQVFVQVPELYETGYNLTIYYTGEGNGYKAIFGKASVATSQSGDQIQYDLVFEKGRPHP
jgi:hypothetical protein